MILNFFWRTLLVGICFSFCCYSPSVFAQKSVTLNRFFPSETPEDDFQISRPTDLGHLRFGAQIHFDYANNPLVYETALGSPSSEAVAVIANQMNMTLGAALGLWNRLVIYAGLPAVLWMEGGDPASLAALGITDQPDDAGLGDVYLGARVRIWGEKDDIGAVGFQTTVTFPTAGDDQQFSGEDFMTVSPEALFELRPWILRTVINVGARFRKDAGSGAFNFEVEDEFTFGFGAAVPLYQPDAHPGRHLDLHAQLYGSTELTNFFDREATPVEMLGGLKFFHESGFLGGVAAGPGLFRGFGSPDLRIVWMFGFACPEKQPEPVKAPSDRDGDGIFDDQDQCPDDPEDVDQFEDTNGCSEPDNDKDGITDLVDSCPNDPEDVDQFQDTDGCPDPDNDQDGILDAEDACPLEAGPVETKGCPDRDGDTVVDHVDHCPEVSGPVENNGCPLRENIIVREDHIEILEKVHFRTGTAVIEKSSHALLLSVAEVLNANTRIKRVSIEGHTDSRGNHDYNVKLSQQRAESVQKFLIEQGGMDPNRLEAHGYGPDQPEVPNARKAADHARNRRVEFKIVQSDENSEAVQ